MTDLEMTKLCAQAMGFRLVYPDDVNFPVCVESTIGAGFYRPLDDDTQAMGLVKELGLDIQHYYWSEPEVSKHDAHGKPLAEAKNENLNRAIVECAAKLCLSK